VKTDSLFYQIFLRFPDSFFDLIGQPRQQAANYQFTSQEVKQLSFRLDGLSKIWVKTPSFYDGFKLQWKKR
jgi:predicted transposase YdaD